MDESATQEMMQVSGKNICLALFGMFARPTNNMFILFYWRCISKLISLEPDMSSEYVAREEGLLGTPALLIAP